MSGDGDGGGGSRGDGGSRGGKNDGPLAAKGAPLAENQIDDVNRNHNPSADQNSIAHKAPHGGPG
jgi:hypothetical protein